MNTNSSGVLEESKALRPVHDGDIQVEGLLEELTGMADDKKDQFIALKTSIDSQITFVLRRLEAVRN